MSFVFLHCLFPSSTPPPLPLRLLAIAFDSVQICEEFFHSVFVCVSVGSVDAGDDDKHPAGKNVMASHTPHTTTHTHILTFIHMSCYRFLTFALRYQAHTHTPAAQFPYPRKLHTHVMAYMLYVCKMLPHMYIQSQYVCAEINPKPSGVYGNTFHINPFMHV